MIRTTDPRIVGAGTKVTHSQTTCGIWRHVFAQEIPVISEINLAARADIDAKLDKLENFVCSEPA
jgi:hypothetical protein